MEGALADAERAVLESHLLGCTRCQAEVEEWQALFSVLSELPQLSPSPGFADRVMAGVKLPEPWYVRATARVERWLPKTTRGWALVTAILSLPVLTFGALGLWLVSQPYLSVSMLLAFIQVRGAELMRAVGGRAAEAILTSEATLWLTRQVEAVGTAVTVEQIGALAALLAALTAVSAWVLYRNLFQTSTRETHYVSYSF